MKTTKAEYRMGRMIVSAMRLGGVLFLTVASAGIGLANDEQFTNDTMETKVTSPAPNIMILHDNSGSMDWEFMAPESQGQFHGNYYLWDLGSDDTYSSGSVIDPVEWQGQWYGYNKIFYNPNIIYEPWPRWNKTDSTEDSNGVTIGNGGDYPAFNADLKTPRPNPIFRYAPLNLHSQYTSLPTLNAVVVDDEDGSSSFTQSGFSSSSSYTPSWPTDDDNYSYAGTAKSNQTATFTPNLTAGRYNVWGWWPCRATGDSNALIKLNINGTVYQERRSQQATYDNTVRSGYCGEWVPLFSKTLYSMPSGSKTSLSIIRDSSSTQRYTYADAMAFLPEGYSAPMEAVSIKNAHYYMVNDANGDGAPQNGEAYLVNFVWTDSDGDSKVDDGEVLRHYYLITYDNDPGNHEDVVSLKEVNYNSADPASDAVPDSIQPKTYNDDGTIKSFVSDFNDLQNFANWFSFYQRRELVAKAAVSRTLVKLDNVYMGYKTLHRDNTNGGANQPVLPIKVIQTIDPSVIVDNLSSIGFSVSRSSRWSRSSSISPAWKDSSRYTTRSGEWALFQPTISEAGLYKVSAWWPCRDDYDKNAKLTIVHKTGTETAYYNQRATADGVVTEGTDCKDTSAATGCCGYWIELGDYYFDAGTTGSVEIERHSGSTSRSKTAADAVQFQFQGSLNSKNVDQTNTLLDVIYRIKSADGTPLRQTLQDIGQYYDQDDSNDGTIGDSPYLSEAEGGACQQTYAVAMTDGYWNGSSPSVGNVDQNLGSPYADSWSDTLADVSAYYYNKDLASSLADEMPTNNYDKMKSQHMVTFAVSFGLNGTIDRNDIDGDGVPDDPSYADDPYFLNIDTPKPNWPQPSSDDATTIDDLWHTSVNGHGRFFVADDPDSLVSALTETFADIGSRKASGASVSVNGDELSEGLVLFQSSYTSGIWKGDVTAYPINSTTGEVDKLNPKWHANDLVQNQDWDSERNIVTFNGSTGVPFRYDSLSTVQQAALENNADVVTYLRGKKITGFRERERENGAVSPVLGDLVHSAPLLITALSPETDGVDNNGNGVIDENGEGGGTLYVGGNDGMLHAFNAETGVERFAYIPFHSFDYLDELTKADYEHRYYVDGRQQFKRMTFLAGDQSHDGKDNDYDGCIDLTNTGCPVGTVEISNGDNEDYSDGVDNDGDGTIDEEYEYKTVTLLVGMLNKGGRGLYALDVTNADSINPTRDGIDENTIAAMVKWEYPPVSSDVKYTFVGDQSNDTIDNDGDGVVDEADENHSDGFDNNGDGSIDEAGETALTSSSDDPDIGYTFGDAFIVRSYKSRYEAYPYDKNGTYYPERNPWVVIFGNGYQSKNGGAVLYVLDAMTGTLVRKIVADRSGNNGLSSPAIIDVDNDSRADFVYAGDLKGNMWKFDIRDPDPRNWGVAFGKDNYNDTSMTDADGNRIERIDYDDLDSSNGTRDIPMPLIHVINRPITTAPDVAFHPSKDGYLVVFGTGKFLGDADIHDNSQQGIFGVWDFGVTAKDYLGDWSYNSFTEPASIAGFGSLPFANVTLLEQKQIDWRVASNGSFLRTLSSYQPEWTASDLCHDNIDNDNDGTVDNESCVPTGGNVGWFFELPYLNSDGELAGERVIKDVMIRSGRVIFISMIPGESSCSGGGNSILHEISLADGGRLTEPVFDINNDGVIDENDLIEITDEDGNVVKVPPTGVMYGGILHFPIIIKGKNNDELKYSSTSAGTTEMIRETAEEIGFYYWKEHVSE
jgi:Tfp pilus tip-associated adhesin PilY1